MRLPAHPPTHAHASLHPLAGVPVSKPVLGNCNGYTVRGGDTIWTIAQMFQVGGAWLGG